MEDTYNVQAIVLNRRPSGENDSRVTVYSRASGKLELIARGTRKIKSKLAGHLEPFNLVDIMVVRGQKNDYAGAAVSEKCYGQIKCDLAKLAAAGRAVKVLSQLIKPGIADEEIFELLKNLLDALERGRKDFEILVWFFILKLLASLGQKPELTRCLGCGRKIQPAQNRFDLARGGLVCAKCASAGDINQLALSDNGIKLLRLALKDDFTRLAKIKISKKLGQEVSRLIEKFYRYGV